MTKNSKKSLNTFSFLFYIQQKYIKEPHGATIAILTSNSAPNVDKGLTNEIENSKLKKKWPGF